MIHNSNIEICKNYNRKMKYKILNRNKTRSYKFNKMIRKALKFKTKIKF